MCDCGLRACSVSAYDYPDLRGALSDLTPAVYVLPDDADALTENVYHTNAWRRDSSPAHIRFEDIPIHRGHVSLAHGQCSDHYVSKREIMANPALCEKLIDALTYALAQGGRPDADFVASPASASVVGYGVARRLGMAHVPFDDLAHIAGEHEWRERVNIASIQSKYHTKFVAVDDVWTTGGTLRSLSNSIQYREGQQFAIVHAGVLVNRSSGADIWPVSAIQIPLHSWPTSECEICGMDTGGEPPRIPGSGVLA